MELKEHIPLHHQLRVYLEDGIKDGRFKEGELLPAEPELMKKFSVSRGTVRKAYDALVAAGLVERRSGKGSFVKQRENVKPLRVAVVMADPGILNVETNPTNWQLCLDKLNGVIATAAVEGAEVELVRYQPMLFKDDLFDGYIVLDSNNILADVINLEPAGRIVVVSEVAVETPHCLVRGDIQRCFQEATNFLASQNFERIAYVGSWDDLRFGSFKRALELNHKVFYPDLTAEALVGTVEDGFQAAKQLFERVKPETVDAVFCTTDIRARGVMSYLQQHAIKVPDDISVMGFDNLKFGAHEKIKLTTYETPRVELGKKAVKTLVKMLRNPSFKPENITLSGKLIQRESVSVK